MSSSYDQKVVALAAAIQRAVKFGSLEWAEKMANAWRQFGSEEYAELERLAGALLKQAAHPSINIAEMLKSIGGCDGARRSALREAIRICAEGYLQRHQARIDRETGCEQHLGDLVAAVT